MAQYSKDVYNLAPGLGRAINDPREDEARGRETSLRADQELALRRQQQAQAQAMANREMAAREQALSFEQALASQARGGGMTPAYGDGQAAAPAARSAQGSMMGRDAIMRQVNTMAAAEKQADYVRNAGLDLDSVFGGGPSTDTVWQQPPGGGLLDMPRQIPRNRGTGGPTVSVAQTLPRGGEVFQAGRLPAAEAMAQELGFKGAETNLDLALRNMVLGEKEGENVRNIRTRGADLADRSQSEIEAQARAQERFEGRRVDLADEQLRANLEEMTSRRGMDRERLQMDKYRNDADISQSQQRLTMDREFGQGGLDLQRRAQTMQEQAQSFQMGQAIQAMSQETKSTVMGLLQDEDVAKMRMSGEPNTTASMKIETIRKLYPDSNQFLDQVLGGPIQQEIARDAGHSVFRGRDSNLIPYGLAAPFIDTDREREGPAQDRFNRGSGTPAPPAPPAPKAPPSARIGVSASGDIPPRRTALQDSWTPEWMRVLWGGR